MKICAEPTCNAAADLWWHGAWCGRHAFEHFGAVVGTLSTIGTPVAAPAAAPVGEADHDAPASASSSPTPAARSGSDGPDLAAITLLDLEWALYDFLETP